MANTVDKVIKVAETEVGYLEKKSNKNLDSKTANAGSANYTKYGRDMHKIYPSVMDFPAYWCDAFVDWCFYTAYGVCNAKGLLGGNFDDYTVASVQLYKNKNAWYTKNPKVGDQIFFTNGKRICHTGLVYKVDAKYVYTIEGNTSGASGVISNGGGVCKKKYLLTDSKIAGYGRPKYDVASSASASSSTNTGGNYMFKVPDLTKGDKGKAVELLQKLLVGEGYKLTVDGDFGAKTFDAVEKFQKREGIKVNYPGTVGAKTWTKLIGL